MNTIPLRTLNFASDSTPRDRSSPPVLPFTGVRIQRTAVAIVTVLAFLAAAWIASALWAGLLLGILTAFSLEPAHRALLRVLPRRSLSAVLVIGALTLAVIGLAVGVVAIVASEARSGVRTVQHLINDVAPHGVAGPRLRSALVALGLEPTAIDTRLAHVADRAAEAGTAVVSVVLGSMFQVIGGAIIAIVTAFYVLKDRRPIERRLAQILPLHPPSDDGRARRRIPQGRARHPGRKRPRGPRAGRARLARHSRSAASRTRSAPARRRLRPRLVHPCPRHPPHLGPGVGLLAASPAIVRSPAIFELCLGASS